MKDANRDGDIYTVVKQEYIFLIVRACSQPNCAMTIWKEVANFEALSGVSPAIV